jgi:hypothetical protein
MQPGTLATGPQRRSVDAMSVHEFLSDYIASYPENDVTIPHLGKEFNFVDSKYYQYALMPVSVTGRETRRQIRRSILQRCY